MVILRNMTSLYLTVPEGVVCLYRVGSRVANNKYIGSAGGHFEQSELNDPRACVLREAWEELGLTEQDLPDMTLRYITYRLKNGEIRQNYYYFAPLPEGRELRSTEGTLQRIPWDRLAELDMPVSARHMILHYAAEGRFTDRIYAGITRESGTCFVPLEEFEG